MKKLLQITCLFIVFLSLSAQAQDKIHKTNGDILEVKVVEIGSLEIKYKMFDNLNGPVYNINKTQVKSIVYENGKEEMYGPKSMEPTNLKRAQNIYIEALAQGLVLSANYDTRFGKTRNGLGARIGLGALGVDGTTIFTVPVSINYLLGKGKNFFEIGLGATYASLSNDEDDVIFGTGKTVVGTTAFMYRLQPIESGFSIRVGLTPLFTSDDFLPYYGFSLGYTF